MKTESKPIAVICENGIVKFYNPDGSRMLDHPTGFFNSRDLDFYKQNYTVRFSINHQNLSR